MILPLRHLPNLLSCLRIALCAPIAAALAQRRLGLTLLLFGAAAVSDGLDGLLAKRCGWRTELGGLLDPAADKLLLATVFVTLALLGDVPVWLMAAAVGRDAVIVAGTLAYRRWIGAVRMQPTLISKFNTLCQLGYLAAVIARLQFAALPAWPVTLLGALVLATTVVSGLDYVIAYAARAAAGAAGRPVS